MRPDSGTCHCGIVRANRVHGRSCSSFGIPYPNLLDIGMSWSPSFSSTLPPQDDGRDDVTTTSASLPLKEIYLSVRPELKLMAGQKLAYAELVFGEVGSVTDMHSGSLLPQEGQMYLNGKRRLSKMQDTGYFVYFR